MGWFCVPQSIGLVRSLKSGQSNRAEGRKLVMEMCEERASRSKTLDRARSDDNVYERYDDGAWVPLEDARGEHIWDAMVADADEYRSKYVDKNGKERSRRLPKQAVIGVEIIVNPPSEIADTWDTETHVKFHDDASEVLEEIEPRLFARENAVVRAHHFDEGLEGHGADVHTVYTAKDNGRYCGSIYDANLRQRMAKEFAVKMRERGWEIDDPELTDWDRYKNDAEYKNRIDEKRKKQNRSQGDYAAQQADELAEKLDEAQEELNSTIAACESGAATYHQIQRYIGESADDLADLDAEYDERAANLEIEHRAHCAKLDEEYTVKRGKLQAKLDDVKADIAMQKQDWARELERREKELADYEGIMEKRNVGIFDFLKEHAFTEELQEWLAEMEDAYEEHLRLMWATKPSAYLDESYSTPDSLTGAESSTVKRTPRYTGKKPKTERVQEPVKSMQPDSDRITFDDYQH